MAFNHGLQLLRVSGKKLLQNLAVFTQGDLKIFRGYFPYAVYEKDTAATPIELIQTRKLLIVCHLD